MSLCVLRTSGSIHFFFYRNDIVIYTLSTIRFKIDSFSFDDVNSTIDRTLSSCYLVPNKCVDCYRKLTRFHDNPSLVRHSANKLEMKSVI